MRLVRIWIWLSDEFKIELSIDHWTEDMNVDAEVDLNNVLTSSSHLSWCAQGLQAFRRLMKFWSYPPPSKKKLDAQFMPWLCEDQSQIVAVLTRRFRFCMSSNLPLQFKSALSCFPTSEYLKSTEEVSCSITINCSWKSRNSLHDEISWANRPELMTVCLAVLWVSFLTFFRMLESCWEPELTLDSWCLARYTSAVRGFIGCISGAWAWIDVFNTSLVAQYYTKNASLTENQLCGRYNSIAIDVLIFLTPSLQQQFWCMRYTAKSVCVKTSRRNSSFVAKSLCFVQAFSFWGEGSWNRWKLFTSWRKVSTATAMILRSGRRTFDSGDEDHDLLSLNFESCLFKIDDVRGFGSNDSYWIEFG